MANQAREASAKKFDSRRLMSPAVHLLFIGIIFFLPEVLMRIAFSWNGSMPWTVYAKSGVMVAVFYINYFLIIPRTIVKGNHWWRFIAINLLLVILAALVMYQINRFGWHPRHGRRPRANYDEWHQLLAATSFILRDAISLILIVSLAALLRLSDKWMDIERRQRALHASQRESELENLRSQLNPHFLFNTLNSIYALIAVSPDEAQKAVHELSGLLRYVVYENPDKVPVSREVDFVENYVELMRLRMGTRPVSLTVDREGDPSMAPLLFVTLVENAFKHGNTANPSQPIAIAIDADDSHISCTTVNHYDPATRKDSGVGGVGLNNLRRRLELLYGKNAELKMDCSDKGVCTVTLYITTK